MGAKVHHAASGPARHPIQMFPEDVRAWTGSDLLVRLTLNAAQAMHWPEREGTFQFAGESHRSTLLLTILVHAYAAGVMDSHELQGRLRTDRDLRYLCANNFPEWATLRRFRRLHRPAIQFVLTELLRQVWINQPVATNAVTEPDFAFEAVTRINAAVLADASAMDD